MSAAAASNDEWTQMTQELFTHANLAESPQRSSDTRSNRSSNVTSVHMSDDSDGWQDEDDEMQPRFESIDQATAGAVAINLIVQILLH